jgi:amino-acid N-acetyltransferase
MVKVPQIEHSSQLVAWLREAAPYIHEFRGNTFVIAAPGEMLADGSFGALAQDLNLLSSLGVRLVLAHGARPQIESALTQRQVESRYVRGIRVTDGEALEVVKREVGKLIVEVSSAVFRVKATSGNFVVARPIGVIDGVDLMFSGEVRKVDAAAIERHLALGEIVVVPPLGFSPAGDVFNLTFESVASEVAIALRADKLLFLGDAEGIKGRDGSVLRELCASEVADELRSAPHLESALRALEAGVSRVHVLNRNIDGGLLLELFTHGGIGSMITRDPLVRLRAATFDDVNGILALLQPLEADGTLVKRSRELLQNDFERFSVLKHDRTIIGCAALHRLSDGAAELACLAVHPDYRRQGCAERLLKHAEARAREFDAAQLFVLTTRTAHWFLERGFVEAGVESLPGQKRALYNDERRSKILVKTL